MDMTNTDFAATQTDDECDYDVVRRVTGHNDACALIQIENAEENLGGLTYEQAINEACAYLLTVELSACPYCS